ASRPVAARWADGHVEVFARGTDGHLYHTWYDGMWHPWGMMSAGTTIQGEPSVMVNGGAKQGLEVFARDAQNKVVHSWREAERTEATAESMTAEASSPAKAHTDARSAPLPSGATGLFWVWRCHSDWAGCDAVLASLDRALSHPHRLGWCLSSNRLRLGLN